MLIKLEKNFCSKVGLILILWCFTDITYAGFPGIEFTDGSGFVPSVTLGGSNQAFGRFVLQVGFESATLTDATIKLNGTRTGMTNFKLWSSTNSTFESGSDTQLGSTIGVDPGSGENATFSSFASSIAALPSVSTFFLSADVASNATGAIRGVIVNNSSLVFTGQATLNQTISNANLSSSDVALPVELTSFAAASTRSDAIELTWVTESEIDNLGFIIER
ncbi:hypothetical protein HQ531_13775, partial [bacterium]|nr:hypothetical protein [bacterium]